MQKADFVLGKMGYCSPCLKLEGSAASLSRPLSLGVCGGSRKYREAVRKPFEKMVIDTVLLPLVCVY